MNYINGAIKLYRIQTIFYSNMSILENTWIERQITPKIIEKKSNTLYKVNIK